jgi:TPR repeat protein
MKSIFLLFFALSSLLFATHSLALEFLLDASEDKVIQEELVDAEENFEEQKTIFTKLQEMAKRGDGSSQISLARMYQKGINIKQDDELAFYWFQQASNLGYDQAQLIVAESLENGIGTDKDHSRALKLYKKLAKKGNAKALYYLGKMYNENLATIDKGLEYGLRAAKKGYMPAQYLVAQIYHVGNRKFRDLEQAKYWYKKAAQQGNAKAQYNLANFYYLSKGGDRSFKKAFKWYQKAAKQGHVRAQYSLGLRYLLGKGVDKNYEKAAKWLLASAKQGNAFAQYSIALRYALGQGVRKSQEEKVFWLKKAAVQNHQQSQYSLGAYYLSKGKKNLAIKYFKKAANSGHSLAQKKLKELNQVDDEIKIPSIKKNNTRVYKKELLTQFRSKKPSKKSNKVVDLLRRKANQGDLNAQNDLGVLYSKGTLVPKNTTKALYWIEKAAQSGFIDALNNITVIYIVGEIVETDYEKAYFYAKQSAKQGDEKGKLLVDFLEERLSEQ